MEAAEEQIIMKTTDKEISTAISSSKRHNFGLKALLSIKSNPATLEKDYSELLHIESELDRLNKNGLLIIEANTLPEATVRWKAVIQEVNKAVTGINNTLSAAKDKIVQKEKEGYPDLWKQLALHLTSLKDNSNNAGNSGLTFLPETFHSQWEREFVKPEKTLVESLVAHVESYRVLVQVIERYTPDELNTITQIIADHVPSDFTYEEAVEYQKDYFKALVNFKNEFKADKNLWDKFLDILAGGTHQTPSEGVMMERWLDGEEGNL
jgi:hypothetical protein